tara:strand:- start:1074 stop:1220 length:147 start_codon:yes stop_codon:yes gene_type:complete
MNEYLTDNIKGAELIDEDVVHQLKDIRLLLVIISLAEIAHMFFDIIKP